MVSVSQYWGGGGGGIRNQMPEPIQVIGPIVHEDVLARANIGCESFFGGR